jgi:hypothetical protein
MTNLISSIALIIAVLKMPYFYYQVLRWLITACSLINLSKESNQIYKLIFILIVIVFNPILPFYFGSILWKIIDFITAIWFIYYFYINRKET